MADKKPTPLVGVQRGGHTVDGQFIIFEFEANTGKRFLFSCPHEAVSEIVDTLLGLAEAARVLRGDPEVEAIPPGTELRQAARAVTYLHPALTKDGQAIVVTLHRGPVLKHKMLMEPHQCKAFGDRLLEVHKEWLEKFPPH